MTRLTRRVLAVSTVWATAFGLVGALAMLCISAGHNLAGEVAFLLGRLPRGLLLSAGGPDADASPSLYAGLAGVLTFLIALLILILSSLPSRDGRRLPLGGVVAGALLLWEIGYLTFGDIPRYVLGDRRFEVFLPAHIGAVGLTFGYVMWLRKSGQPAWLGRSYWLLMFLLALCVLFPMTDSL